MPPTVTARIATSARLLLVDSTVMPVEFVTSPSMSMFVPPLTIADGIATATDRKPPDATSLWVSEWLFDRAVISMRPAALSDEADVPRISTSAALVISDSARLKLPEKPRLTLKTKMFDSAWFCPFALIAMAGESGDDAVEVVVTWPSIWTRTAPAMVAFEIMIERAATPPSEPSLVSASARLCWLRVFASMSTGPELVRYAVEPMNVSMRASAVMSANAAAPERPMTDTLASRDSAMALLSAIDWIVIDDELLNDPLTVVRVAPATMAKASSAVTAMPPPAPPGVCTSVRFVATARITTAPVVLTFAVEPTVVSVSRSLFARATVTPIAPTPVVTLTVCALRSWLPSVLISTPPEPTVP